MLNVVEHLLYQCDVTSGKQVKGTVHTFPHSHVIQKFVTRNIKDDKNIMKNVFCP